MSAPLSASAISSSWSSAALRPTSGSGSSAKAARELATDVELDVCVRHQQRLRVGVDRDELRALEANVDHAVHGIDAATANANNLDRGDVVLWCGHDRFPSTLTFNSRLIVMSSCPALTVRG